LPRVDESPIRIENRLPGSGAFALQNPTLDREVEGYASAVSAVAGDLVDICVSVDREQGVRWDLYRIGYYQGLGARLVTSGELKSVTSQAIPSANAANGLIECDWPVTFSVAVDANWLTGYYLFKLTNDDGFESYVPLIVCEAEARAPLLVQASVTTWQAYNRWGKISLYVNQTDPQSFSGARGYMVSFDRPYASGTDIGFVEHSMVRWLEQHGYDVAYVTNLDIDRAPALLQQRKLFMSVGHDEYWSLSERRSLQKMRDKGLSLAFFSGNTGYRRIRFADSSKNVPQRTIVCYKSGSLDPHRNAPDTTADYQRSPHAQPENGLVGVLWAGWAMMDGFAFIVSTPDHWMYAGTGVSAGDTLGHIIGYEWDISADNGVSPAELEVVAESPVLHEYGYPSTAQATMYYPTPSNFVFGAGTIGWAKGLSDPDSVDPRVQRVTQNILSRAGLFPEQTMIVPPPAQPEPVRARSARIFAGTGQAGRTDGESSVAQLASPGGLVALPSGELYVCDTGNHRLRKISTDGQVSTVTLTNAQGKPVRLSSPSGIALGAAGQVFVSDTGNHRILLIDENGVTSTYAGSAGHAGSADAADPGGARFNFPRGLAFDAVGALYVADFRGDAVRRIDAAGVATVVSTAGGPTAVAVGPDGTLYYVGTAIGSIMSVSSRGKALTLANLNQTYGSRNGPGAQALLRPGDGLVVTTRGLLFSDIANNRVRALAFDAWHTVSTVLGTSRGGGSLGSSAQTALSVPRGLCPLGEGFVVADSGNHRIVQFDFAWDT
ncbi:MAG: N,N-dimethylformamidase beta subunit family domain-containing protein, partial [Polyangiaceae bacterium]